jgi:hypothetical protein
MFTFGRDREKESAAHHVRDPQQVPLIHAAVDAVHDFLEGRIAPDALQAALRRAFVEGGSGAWEQAGSWVRRLANEYPAVLSLWRELAHHPDARVRFRAACFLNEMPQPLVTEIGNELRTDRSKKVRDMAQGRPEEIAVEPPVAPDPRIDDDGAT